jgi:hypothetical protein
MSEKREDVVRRVGFSLLIGLMMAATLAACGSPNGGSAAGVSATNPRLKENYGDALSIGTQLAAGTLLLEGGDLAVDETQAAELLPLWQAAQSLTTSDTAAPQEIHAVYGQIQDNMTSDQIAAIADMKLTNDGLATMIENGELNIGRGAFASGDGNGERNTRGFGDFVPPEGGFGPPGGFGGGGPGGDQGGGFFGGFGGDGPNGGFSAGADPEAQATRRAQLAGNNGGDFQDMALIGAVIRAMEVKTGEAAQGQVRGPFSVAYSVVADGTGLTAEEIQAKLNEGETLASIIESSGGDVDEVRDALIEALGDLPNAGEIDIEALVSQWLGRAGE